MGGAKDYTYTLYFTHTVATVWQVSEFCWKPEVYVSEKRKGETGSTDHLASHTSLQLQLLIYTILYAQIHIFHHSICQFFLYKNPCVQFYFGTKRLPIPTTAVTHMNTNALENIFWTPRPAKPHSENICENSKWQSIHEWAGREELKYIHSCSDTTFRAWDWGREWGIPDVICPPLSFMPTLLP